MNRACVCVVAALVWSAGMATRAATPSDIVIYASDVTVMQGNWSKVANSSSPGGVTLASADAGWSSTTAPLASPANYVEATFTAPSATAYHVWLRMHATGNSKYNDSVFLQYSDATDAGGAAQFGLGTTTGVTVNLAPDSTNNGLSGWGWQDGAYWLTQPRTIRFATTGTHTLRIQTREDGVQIDQIVLSPANYLTSAPGQLMNDATVVPRPAVVAPPAPSSTPYSGSPIAIPGTIQTANFDNGGEGVAYHDTTPGNSGGAYRQTDVDLEASADGGYDVGWASAGEWLKYTVNVATAGSYTLTARVASSGQGGTFHLEMNGANVTGAIAVPDTGGWQTWQSVTKSVTLAAGAQVARLVMDTAGAGGAVGNITSLRLTSASTPAPPSGTSAYGGTPAAIPGTIQAANFDNGGEGAAYHDTTPGNAGAAYRSTDVDLQPSSDGGYNVGWTAAGEWLNYTVSVASAGSYTAQLRVASPGGASMHVGFNGPSSVSAAVTIPATGGWQTWANVSVPVTLGAGSQVMTLRFDNGGVNLKSVILSPGVAPTPTPTPPPPSGGNTVTVPAGGNLQAAIDAAQAGDTILLVPGATYSGSFVLPLKSGASYITIRSAAPDSVLPAAGTRISPAYASQLPKVEGGFAGMSAFITAAGAHHYRLLFLEIVSTYAENNIVQLGDGNATQYLMSQLAHDLVVDRCYIHGDAARGQKRGIALNSASTSIVNSYIADIKSPNEDTQAIMAWNGPGPYTIENNYLEAAGETVMIGGADPAISGLVPSDISIRFNHITKQASWRGQAWVVKNLLELKNAQRVVVDDNLLEYSWAAAQAGFAILLTPRNQDGTAPQAVVQHVQITNNTIRHVAAGVNILGRDDSNPSQMTNDITVRNNVFVDISAANWGGAGQFLLTQGGQNIVVDHNTVFTDGSSAVYADVAPVSGFVFTNNIFPANTWGVKGSGAGEGNDTIGRYFPGATFQRNVIIAGAPSIYPANNFFPATGGAVGFIDVAGGNYALASTSAFKRAGTDGTDIGFIPF